MEISKSVYLNIIFFCGLFGLISTQLEEGSECNLDNGEIGICKKLPECPPKLEDARKGRRTALSSRCGFSGFIEVVCCPIPVQEKIGIRPADVACHDYENEILSVERLSWHILAGIEAEAEEFPYMAALGYLDKSEDDVTENAENGGSKRKIAYLCGGTIIAPRFVLTAAHCVSNFNENVPIMVRVGSVDLESKDPNAQTIAIKEVIPHAKYKRSTMYYDIALLKLIEPINWSKTVKPICLQTKPASTLKTDIPGTYLVVVGWGATDIDQDQSSKLLKTPSLQFESKENCSVAYQGFRQLPFGLDDKMICAKDPNSTRRADACQGDSGGPLLLLSSSGDTVIGVTSFGQSCGGPNAAVYTSVYSFIDWIEENVWPERVNK
ncbi:serine protease persephone isoform X1 [Microplitis demolitor]|uniref:serine protease persephone isoform X1 n=1 Tax=Microplitis demolitor TaxID=69319 RepID=UPI00044000CF|nr:serine protease persephone isoform X1 [Microplitis demolitor]